MTYITAEQSEGPIVGSHQYVPTEALPGCTRPLAKLLGPLVFTQDEYRRLPSFGFVSEPAAAILADGTEQCRRGHVGHILRQRVEIALCPIVSYSYRHADATHSIYVNVQHQIIEDVDGPIQAFIRDTERLAEEAFKAKRYEVAYRLILRALVMDEATTSEQALRSRILSKLDRRFMLVSIATWLPIVVAWFLGSAIDNEGVAVIGIVGSLLPLMLGRLLLARDVGLRFGDKRTAVAAAMLTATCAVASAAPIHMSAATWPSLVTDYTGFAIVTGAAAVAVLIRRKERSRRTRIEAHRREFATTGRLELYVRSLDPDPRWERRTLAWIVVGTTLVIIGATAAIRTALAAGQ